MAENKECVETKNPRVEIDTSPPFESVKEAVDHFGGGGPWIPLHLLRLAAAHRDNVPFDMEKIEEQTIQLERELMIKQQQTHEVLKELEAAKQLIESLKVNRMPEFSSCMTSPDLKFELPNENSTEGLNLGSAPGLMFTELNQAKRNLDRTSIDLAAIQSSLESLNKKLREDKVLLERRTKMQIQNPEVEYSSSHENHWRNRYLDQKAETGYTSDIVSPYNELNEVNFEVEQFKKITEASRYEVMKAMAEIELTRTSIKMAEMRLNAAKKMEEAAKAVKAIALAGKSTFLINTEDSSDIFPPPKNDEMMFSFEEYKSLSRKVKQTEEICKTKFISTNKACHVEVPIFRKFEDGEEPHRENIVFEGSRNNMAKFKFRNSHNGRRYNHDALNENESCFRSTTTSMGDILRTKMVVQDDVMVGRRVEDNSEMEPVSLRQMLSEQSRLILHPDRPTGDRNVEKKYLFRRKKFGFIQVPVYSKNKARNVNVNVR